MPRLTEQCKQTIIDLYRSGMSTNEVSKQVGVSQSSVSRVLQRCGIIIRPMSSYKSSLRFSTEKELQIIDLYVNQKQTTLSIAKQFHTYNTSIRRVLLRYGITPRPNQALQQTVSLSDIASKEGTQDFDYFLGLLATDGCITGNKVVLEFSKENKELLDYWNTFLGNKCTITISLHKTYKVPQYRIAFRNAEICGFLSTFGIVPRKTFALKLKYINWDVLRGILDGDGSVVSMNRGNSLRFQITSGSLEFLTQISEFLLLHGIQAHICINKPTTYSLSVYKQEHILKIYSNLYAKAHFFLKRKKEKFGPLLRKLSSEDSVNSGKELVLFNREPSHSSNAVEGVET